MKYLIDTNICIYIMNKRPTKIIQKFKKFEPGDIGVSTITVSELQHGVAKSKYKGRNRVRLEEFLTPLQILPYDQTAAIFYGDIRFQLEIRGLQIGSLDMLIAAQSMGHDLILITNNEREFKRIKKMKVENWVK